LLGKQGLVGLHQVIELLVVGEGTDQFQHHRDVRAGGAADFCGSVHLNLRS
jgi:hypothetical protein